jgi:hypothetical protein
MRIAADCFSDGFLDWVFSFFRHSVILQTFCKCALMRFHLIRLISFHLIEKFYLRPACCPNRFCAFASNAPRAHGFTKTDSFKSLVIAFRSSTPKIFLNLLRIVSALCPQSSGHSADVVRFSLGWGWRSPRSGTIDRFFCAYKPLEPWVSKLQRVPACVARSVPARIRSIEETASSPGPVDYNCNPVPACVARSIPARIDLSRKPHRVPAPWITTATRPGVSRSMNRPNGATLSSLA